MNQVYNTKGRQWSFKIRVSELHHFEQLIAIMREHYNEADHDEAFLITENEFFNFGATVSFRAVKCEACDKIIQEIDLNKPEC